MKAGKKNRLGLQDLPGLGIMTTTWGRWGFDAEGANERGKDGETCWKGRFQQNLKAVWLSRGGQKLSNKLQSNTGSVCWNSKCGIGGKAKRTKGMALGYSSCEVSKKPGGTKKNTIASLNNLMTQTSIFLLLPCVHHSRIWRGQESIGTTLYT